MRDVIYKMITDIVDNTVDVVIGEEQYAENWNLAELNSLLLPIVPLQPLTKERVVPEQRNKKILDGKVFKVVARGGADGRLRCPSDGTDSSHPNSGPVDVPFSSL